MPRLTYSGVTSTLALCLVLSGGAYAATQLPKHSVGTEQLQKGAVTGSKVKKNSIGVSRLKKNQLPAGPAGPAGPPGPGARYWVADSYDMGSPTRATVKQVDHVTYFSECSNPGQGATPQTGFGLQADSAVHTLTLEGSVDGSTVLETGTDYIQLAFSDGPHTFTGVLHVLFPGGEEAYQMTMTSRAMPAHGCRTYLVLIPLTRS